MRPLCSVTEMDSQAWQGGRDIQRPMDDEAFMSDTEYRSLLARIICLLLFILSSAMIVEYPEWFQ
jgi:hypothetical protein